MGNDGIIVLDSDDSDEEPPPNCLIAVKRKVGQTLQGCNKRKKTDLNRSLEINPKVLCGKIKTVQLRNFMCHGNFEFTFGENINFISGKNGSGKSAILTGLVICLGGRTSDTNRGQCISKLIKSGQSKASVAVKLYNTGIQSYKRELYGDEITIVRTITETSSTYKLVPQTGPSVPLRKEDLMLIITKFNIQVTNPVCILNQDTARTFLKSASPKDLYILFKKGTLLEQISNQIKDITSDRIPELDAIINRNQIAAEDSTRDLMEFNRRMDLHKTHQRLIQEENKAQQLLRWSIVASKEMIVLKAQQEVAEREKDVENIRRNASQGKDRRAELMESNENLKNEINRLKEEISLRDKDTVQFQQTLANQKGCLSKKSTQIDFIKKKIFNEQKQCAELLSYIEDKSERSAELDAKKMKIEADIKEVEKQQVQLGAVRKTTEVHNNSLHDTVSSFTNKIGQATKTVSDLDRNIVSKTNFVQHLKSTSSSYSIYGDWMPGCLQKIENYHREKKFKKKPIGPIGAFIKLKDQSWGPAIESILSQKFLRSFIVDSSHDFNVLAKSVFATLPLPVYKKPSIFCTKFLGRVHNVSGYRVSHPIYQSLIDSIEVTNPEVANLIIDSYQAETILLIPTDEETYPLMEDKSKVPRNCKRVITKEGELFYPAPNYRSYAGHVEDRTRVLQVSKEEAIRSVEDEIQHLQQEKQKAQSALNDLINEERQAKMVLQKALKDLDKIKKQMTMNEDKMNSLRSEMPECVDNNDVLQLDLDHRRIELTQLEVTVKELIKAKVDLSVNIERMEDKRKEMEGIQSKYSQKISEKEKQIAANKLEMKKYTVNQDKFNNLLKSNEEKLSNSQNKLRKLQEELESLLNDARALHEERLVSDMSQEELKQHLHKVTVERKAISKQVGPEPVKPRRHDERMEEHHATVMKLKEDSNFVKKVQARVSGASSQLENVRTFVTSSTSQAFHHILDHRKFRGVLKMDHDNETIQMLINTDNTSSQAVISTLSGGERSFSMVAFIIALWNNMSTPFYFLDEFDVFMDEVNRKIVMDLLMLHAKGNKNKQYVFLTPHATFDGAARDVHFFRMEDPRPQPSTSH